MMRKYYILFILVFILFFFLTQGLLAQDFYVATTGSDSTGDGSNSNPWATITNALDNVPDGSVVLVKPGLYEGHIRLRGIFPTVLLLSGSSLNMEQDEMESSKNNINKYLFMVIFPLLYLYYNWVRLNLIEYINATRINMKTFML